MVFAAYWGVGILLGIVFNSLHLRPDLFLSLFWFNLMILAALLGIYKMLCTLLDDKPLASVGVAFHSRWKTELGTGFTLGAVMILAVAALERAFGLAGFSWMPPTGESQRQVLIWAVVSLILFSVAGTAEELSFRGYPFQRLAESLGPAGAVAVFAALFGAAHLGNRAHTWISTFNTMLVGVTLAVAYLRTRSLWLPIGIHVSWNVIQGYALGFPVSGILLPAALVRPQIHGADWLTGGSYGPEGSLPATGVIVMATAFLLLSKSIYVSKEMRELVGSAPAPNRAEAGAPAGPRGGPAGFPGA